MAGKYGWVFRIVLTIISAFRPVILYLVGLIVVQQLLVTFVFLRKNEEGKRVLALNNRFEIVPCVSQCGPQNAEN